jgi:hypothetical protein
MKGRHNLFLRRARRFPGFCNDLPEEFVASDAFVELRQDRALFQPAAAASGEWKGTLQFHQLPVEIGWA